jgi:hypothetical protein
MAAKIAGHVGIVQSGIVVTYTHTRLGNLQTVASDASGNHSGAALPSGDYVISAQDPAGLLVFNSVSVSLGTADISGINLRSRAKNSSNAVSGF